MASPGVISITSADEMSTKQVSPEFKLCLLFNLCLIYPCWQKKRQRRREKKFRRRLCRSIVSNWYICITSIFSLINTTKGVSEIRIQIIIYPIIQLCKYFLLFFWTKKGMYVLPLIRTCFSIFRQKKTRKNFFRVFVARGGLEPSTPRVWTACSSQLSYLAITGRIPFVVAD